MNNVIQIHSLYYFNLSQGKIEKHGEIHRHKLLPIIMILAMLLNHYLDERGRNKKCDHFLSVDGISTQWNISVEHV